MPWTSSNGCPGGLVNVGERVGPTDSARGGATTVGEYSISAVGPGPRSVRHWAAARRACVKTAAEIQFNNTCEIASIPYLPVMDLVAQHIDNLESEHLSGMMIGWTMGGHPSPNFELAREMNHVPAPRADAVLDALGRERFGAQGAAEGRKAWTLLSKAFARYSFHVSVVYMSPVQVGPANPLYPVRTGYSATMWGLPYDDLKGWRGPYPPEVFATQFETLAEGWRVGDAELERAVRKTPQVRLTEAQADLRFARAAGSISSPLPTRRGTSSPATPSRGSPARSRPRHVVVCGPRCDVAWNQRWIWPASSSRSPGRIPGSVSSPRVSTSTSRWTWSRRSSTAAGCWNTWTARVRTPNRSNAAGPSSLSTTRGATDKNDPVVDSLRSGSARVGRIDRSHLGPISFG